ncbi:hypothetical protein QE197_10855 [Arsenophonus nasoniae]|uniref:Phage tail protein n=1 Tax=Arsenophonus nasoniae TaxID=638 RepID=D2TYM9_9GAMM|nr:hypothetical protein [Arsenophonus nasoniae]QBY43964.1 hypothetical protein ArsFIN_25370 [Arsenophonus nasoniae]WGM04282.1 hypothetical protein QE258_11585 [Arsenophonus nasoniae]WGM09384.1 hypothetical protein QE197_10855 [Arsenophonus nasoniae]WGM14109.1 hypothetical protein QE193_10750 [Arsenophonus nasoniae]CBA72525.1 phage tail protein [Arsenophonus nasoniae]
MLLGFGNNLTSKLSLGISETDTQIKISNGTGIYFQQALNFEIKNPDVKHDYMAKLTLSNADRTKVEIIHLLSVSGDTLTVSRAQKGTGAKAWMVGSVISNLPTKDNQERFVQIEQLQGGDFTYAVASGDSNNITINIPSTFQTTLAFNSPIVVSPVSTNTDKVKLTINLGSKSIGPIPVYRYNKQDLIPGDILSGIPFCVILEKNNDFFTILNPCAIPAGGKTSNDFYRCEKTGFTIQWGTGTLTNQAGTTVIFKTPFLLFCAAVLPISNSSYTTQYPLSVISKTITDFKVQGTPWIAQMKDFSYIAVGY